MPVPFGTSISGEVVMKAAIPPSAELTATIRCFHVVAFTGDRHDEKTLVAEHHERIEPSAIRSSASGTRIRIDIPLPPGGHPMVDPAVRPFGERSYYDWILELRGDVTADFHFPVV